MIPPSKGGKVPSVRNVGLGPAKIVDAQILFDGKSYTDYYEFLSAFLDMPRDSILENIALGYSSLMGRVLSPGENLDAMNINTPHVSYDLFYRQKEWTVRICYASISNKYWINTTFGDAKEVDRCE